MTQFSGAAGRVLWGALSLRSMATGIVLGLVLLVGNWVLFMADAELLTTFFTQIVMALALARFVINGQHGEWQGTVFSGAGGPWSSVVLVASRYLALSLVWLLPLVFFGLRPDAALAAGPPAKNTIILALLYVMASIFTPPLLLIVSAAAKSFGQLFSPAHWKQLFGGRFDDLTSIYAVYSGGLVMSALLAVPVVILGFVLDPKAGLVLAGLALCFLLGVSIDLLGRLCGFFTLGDIGTPSPETAPPVDAGPSLAPHEAPGLGTLATAGAIQAAGMTAGAVSKPLLSDARNQVQSIIDRFEQHPPAAVSSLEELRELYAENAQVLWGLCLSRSRAGDKAGAKELALPAMQLCLTRNVPDLAADVYKELGTDASHVELTEEQHLVVAATLTGRGDLATAATAYSTILCHDPAEVRAVKGLLKVAESISQSKADPAAAAKVYRFLIQRCSASPLIEFAHRGLEEAERSLAKTAVPVS